MGIPETQKELLTYLGSITRDLKVSDLDRFTTQGIARAVSVSRSLASQYLNELVHRGFVVKAGSRPVYYFHRRDLERFLQTSLTEQSYATVDDLFGSLGSMCRRDFACAIGHDLSLSTCVEQLRAAVSYPTCGLPVLISGAPGTGKTLLVKLMLEYGKKSKDPRRGRAVPHGRLHPVPGARRRVCPRAERVGGHQRLAQALRRRHPSSQERGAAAPGGSGARVAERRGARLG